MRVPMPGLSRLNSSDKEELVNALFNTITTNRPSALDDVRRLIELGVDVNAEPPSYAKGSALSNAAYKANPEMCSLLLRHGAKVDEKGTHGYAPLYECLSQAPDPEVADGDEGEEEDSPEQLARLANHESRVTQVARILLEHGANPNLKTCDGASALHSAVEHEFNQALALMIRHGGDPHQMNSNGITPKDMADERNSSSVAVIDAALARRAVDMAVKASGKVPGLGHSS